jgi:hypothetical protein
MALIEATRASGFNYLQIEASLSRRYPAGGCGAKRARRKQEPHSEPRNEGMGMKSE